MSHPPLPCMLVAEEEEHLRMVEKVLSEAGGDPQTGEERQSNHDRVRP